MGFMGTLWIVIIILLILGGWSYLKQSKGAGNPTGSSLDILKERYARGEISREEFEEKKRDLSQ